MITEDFAAEHPAQCGKERQEQALSNQLSALSERPRWRAVHNGLKLHQNRAVSGEPLNILVQIYRKGSRENQENYELESAAAPANFFCDIGIGKQRLLALQFRMGTQGQSQWPGAKS